ncbi:MAG: hypothetical protein M0Z60_05545, partial [Nitrospiraceae bacterium]|nr:hypothetical protein [Nitrospiraceae bacterium]
MRIRELSRQSFASLSLALLLLIPASVYALDAPHTDYPGYDIQCGNCHWVSGASSAPWASIAFSPSSADDTINNRRCWVCHTGG